MAEILGIVNKASPEILALSLLIVASTCGFVWISFFTCQITQHSCRKVATSVVLAFEKFRSLKSRYFVVAYMFSYLPVRCLCRTPSTTWQQWTAKYLKWAQLLKLSAMGTHIMWIPDVNICKHISKFSDWCYKIQEYNVKSGKMNKGKKENLKYIQY